MEAVSVVLTIAALGLLTSQPGNSATTIFRRGLSAYVVYMILVLAFIGSAVLLIMRNDDVPKCPVSGAPISGRDFVYVGGRRVDLCRAQCAHIVSSNPDLYA